MDALLKEWYGILAFVLFDALALLLIITITYTWLFKRIFDILTAFFALVVLSPVILVAYLYALYLKKQGKIEKIIEKEVYVGKKEKRIILHAFAIPKIGKILRVFDVFLGRLSLVGTMLLRPYDVAFLDDDEKERMRVRPGLIHPLVCKGNKTVDYDQALVQEVAYVNRLSFFGDCRCFFTWLIKNIRGEGNEYLGETRALGYAETLLKDERISQEAYEAAKETLV